MSLLEALEKAYTKVRETHRFSPSVVHLCDRHNRDIATEIRDGVPQVESTPSLHIGGFRVSTLFHKPVIEETQNGVTKCLLCTCIQ
jgi:hypothetical protein